MKRGFLLLMVVFISIVISAKFRPICPPASFKVFVEPSLNYWTIEPSLNYWTLLNLRGSPVLIPFVITGYKFYVFLYFYLPAVRIEPATSGWLSTLKLREPTPSGDGFPFPSIYTTFQFLLDVLLALLLVGDLCIFYHNCKGWIPFVAWPGRDISGELNHLKTLPWCHMDPFS